ncbi:hypothetical protein [Sphingomonas sp. PAMC 26605]|uniref:hypothetical protein n=1 Tax=Sphingomonas sp. PAMC 26605 TaxID=1112214 RepID=UPI0018DEE27F|nr:hypothetical protein [Sphingomonas sp. PAMC 26605]
MTVIEPGGFTTDFDGSSITIETGQTEYDELVGKAARMQQAYEGRQPGDPQPGARAVLEVIAAHEPPLRQPPGSDAIGAIERSGKVTSGRARSLGRPQQFDRVRAGQMRQACRLDFPNWRRSGNFYIKSSKTCSSSNVG